MLRRPSRVLLMITVAALATGFVQPADVAASPAHVAAAAGSCRGAHLMPAGRSAGQVRVAVMCLMNRYRATHGRASLRFSPQLNRAAQSYSHAMASARFFGHTAPGGGTMVDRLREAGYIRPRSLWNVGENLGWGTSRLASPASIMKAWVRSPGHRRNILGATYREAGIGVVAIAPSGAPGATYTINFGARRGPALGGLRAP